MFGLAQVDRLKGEACLIMTGMADIVLLILLSLREDGVCINFDLLVLWLELHAAYRVVKPHGWTAGHTAVRSYELGCS